MWLQARFHPLGSSVHPGACAARKMKESRLVSGGERTGIL